MEPHASRQTRWTSALRVLLWVLGGAAVACVLWLLVRAMGWYAFRSVPYLVVVIFVALGVYLERTGFRRDEEVLIERRRRRRERAQGTLELAPPAVQGEQPIAQGRRRSRPPTASPTVLLILGLVAVAFLLAFVPTCASYLGM